MRKRPVFVQWWVSIALLFAGCGGRTMPGAPEAEDGGAGDGGRTDAETPDAGRRDGGVPECARDLDCAEGRSCVSDRALAGEDLAPMPLACDVLGAGGGDGAMCDRAEDCARGLCVVAGTCVPPCALDADCGVDQRCARVYARTGPAALQPLRACVDRWNLPPGAAGDSSLRERVSGSGELLLPAVMPTTVFLLEPLAARMTVTRLETSDGSPTVLYDEDALGFGAPAPRNPFYGDSIPVTIMLPNGPRSVLSERGYVARAFSEGSTEVAITRVVGGGGRVLDLDLYYVGPSGWAPVGERGPPEVATALDRVASILGAVGLRLGDVRQHEVVGGLRAELQVIDADPDLRLPELEELFELSAGAGRPTLNVFFVRAIEIGLGMAGGVPGPPGVHGTKSSGLAISVDLLASPEVPEDVDLGRALAHEIGHYLGLFHTSEFDGTIRDPLPDTPECRHTRDADGDGWVLAAECAGFGADNLMFWAARGESLTEDQASVMVRAPMLAP